MARYNDPDTRQAQLIPVIYSEQILPGSFEHTISMLVENHLDMSIFDARYKNDEAGRVAYHPAMLLRVILSAYARGFTSSRQIEQLCRENVVFMALAGGSVPHFTTIAKFVAQMSDVIQPLYTGILMVCDSQGLIGREMFAIDGCKLPSNASKEWSGTHAELEKKRKKIDREVARILKKHRQEDETNQVNDHTRRAAEEHRTEKLLKASEKIKKHLETSEERRGLSNKPVKSNITDNDSAKMKTSHGTIQGYNGVAAVDDKHQIVIAAEAFGQGPENNLLAPMIEQVEARLGEDFTKHASVTADSGFHSKATLAYCEERNIDALVADGNFRKRDPRFSDKEHHHPASRKKKWYQSDSFNYDPTTEQCVCPSGKLMWRSHTYQYDGSGYVTFIGHLKDCRACPLQDRCMRNPQGDRGRQVSFRQGQSTGENETAVSRMKEKIDSEDGRYRYGLRLGTVEPVFGNINTNKRLDRFSHRGQAKVNAQWLMFCMVHNVEKLQRYGQLSTS